ncbi:hypothetical protein JCM1840_005591 [Sporobolomyces johnsonii]
MLTTLELASKLFGWLSLRRDTFVFYCLWLVGDAGQLIGLYLGSGLLTQQILDWSLVAFELIMVSSLGFFALKARYRVYKGLQSGQSPFGTSSPPFGSLRMREVLRSGKSPKKKTGSKKRTWTKTEIFAIAVIVGILSGMIIVWVFVDFIPRKTAKPDPLSKMPTSTTTWVAYVVAWAGVPCWVGPRLMNIHKSLKDDEPEGITTESVILGDASHFSNIISIALVNNTSDSVLAQLPYMATSVLCASIDVFRLGLKYHISHSRLRKGPARDERRQRRPNRPNHPQDDDPRSSSAEDSDVENPHQNRPGAPLLPSRTSYDRVRPGSRPSSPSNALSDLTALHNQLDAHREAAAGGEESFVRAHPGVQRGRLGGELEWQARREAALHQQIDKVRTRPGLQAKDKEMLEAKHAMWLDDKKRQDDKKHQDDQKTLEQLREHRRKNYGPREKAYPWIQFSKPPDFSLSSGDESDPERRRQDEYNHGHAGPSSNLDSESEQEKRHRRGRRG